MARGKDKTLDALRLMTRGVYALQKLRIQQGLRLCANFRDKLRFNEDLEDPELAEDELSEKAQSVIDILKKDYRRLTDAIAEPKSKAKKNRTLPKRQGFTGEGVISEFSEFALVHGYVELLKQEEEQFKLIGEELETIPIYQTYLKKQRGVGPAMAAVLVSYFDVYKGTYASSFHALAGLDVGPGIESDPDNWLARSRRKEHLIEREYKARDGEIKTKMSTTFDPWLQSRLLGVLGASLMRLQSPYKKVYDNYKHRISTDAKRRKGTLADKKKEWAAGKKTEEIWHPNRIHRAAMRYMVKRFISDFWRAWRELEGLPTPAEYHEGVLGHVHERGDDRPNARE